MMDGLVEEVVEEEILEIRIGTIGRCDILEEDGANDTTSTPHEGNRRLVELPLVLFGRLRKVSQFRESRGQGFLHSG